MTKLYFTNIIVNFLYDKFTFINYNNNINNVANKSQNINKLNNINNNNNKLNIINISNETKLKNKLNITNMSNNIKSNNAESDAELIDRIHKLQKMIEAVKILKGLDDDPKHNFGYINPNSISYSAVNDTYKIFKEKLLNYKSNPKYVEEIENSESNYHELRNLIHVTKYDNNKYILVLDFIINNKINIDFYQHVFNHFSARSLDDIDLYIKRFQILLDKKIIDINKIDWFNTKEGNEMVFYASLCAYKFIEYILKTGINTCNFTDFFNMIFDKYNNCDRDIAYDHKMKKHIEYLLLYITNNYDYIIDEKYLEICLKKMDKKSELYKIIQTLPLKSDTKSASKKISTYEC